MNYKDCLRCDQAVMDILDLGDKVIDRITLGGQVTEKPKKKKIK